MRLRLSSLTVALALTAVPSWAALNACPGTFQTLTAISGFPMGGGCVNTNLEFSNFTVGMATGVIAGFTLVATTTTAVPQGPAVIQPTANDIYLRAAPYGMALGTPNLPIADCDSNYANSVAAWCIAGKNRALTSTVSYTMRTADGGLLDFINLNATTFSHANTTTAIIFREICPGQATFTAGCANYQVLQLGVIEGNFITLNTTVGTTVNPSSVFGMRDTVFLQTFNGAGSFAGTDFYQFEAPEPATVSLVGVTLLGLGFLRRWRKPKT